MVKILTEQKCVVSVKLICVCLLSCMNEQEEPVACTLACMLKCNVTAFNLILDGLTASYIPDEPPQTAD